MTNDEITRRLNELRENIEQSTNNIEGSLLPDEEEPDVARACFENGKLQMQFVELCSLLRHKGVIK